MLRQHLLDDGDGTRDACGIVLALNGEADLLFLEAVENVGGSDGVQTLVLNVADGGLFADVDVEDDALRRLFPFDADILEIAGVPERVEVALDGEGVERL